MASNIYTIRVKVWDEYVVEVEAETAEEAVRFVRHNINQVEKLGYNSDGGRDIDEYDIDICPLDDEEEDEEDDDDESSSYDNDRYGNDDPALNDFEK